MDSFEFRHDECKKLNCIFNEDGICGTGIGCLSEGSDFLNSTIDNIEKETNETYKSFIE